MPDDGDTQRGRQFLGTDRLKAYSDGVFSIAATLLVLDIAVHPPGYLSQILHAWPDYLAYLVSFLTIGAAWMAHTGLTDRLTRSDPVFLQINLLVLLVVAFLPFPTKLVTDALALHNTDAERAAVTVYGLTLLAIRALGSALDAYARRAHLYSPQGDGGDGDEVQGPRRKLLPVLIAYVIAILIGLVLPTAAVVLYCGIAVYLIVPFRHVARLLSRRS
jgi:TMEM175 potassium channel family protein